MKYFMILNLISFLILASSCERTSSKNTTLQFSWSKAGQIPDSSIGLAGPVAGISDGVLIVGGGSNFPNAAPWKGGSKKFYKKGYVFSLQEDPFQALPQRFDLPYKVAYSANCSTTYGMVVAGGQNAKGALDKVLLLSWDSEIKKIKIKELSDLPIPLSSGAIAGTKEDLYFAGGQNAEKVSNQLLHLNLNQLDKGWDTVATLPYPVSHATLYANENQLFLVGGRKRNAEAPSTLYDGVFLFDIQQKVWTEKQSLPFALSAQTGVTWNDSTLLVFSGDQGVTFHQTEELIVKISKEKDSVKRASLMKEKKELQQSHPGFSGEVLAYHTKENKWQKIDSIPFPGQVTTTALKWGDKVIIPGGEIRAGVRTPDIILGERK